MALGIQVLLILAVYVITPTLGDRILRFSKHSSLLNSNFAAKDDAVHFIEMASNFIMIFLLSLLII